MVMKLVVIAAIISLVLLAGCVEEGQEQNGEEPIKIGFLGPLSGPAAYTCEPVKKGFELAHSQKPGFDGREIKLLFEDDKCQAVEAVKATRKFMETDSIKIVVSGVCSNSTLAIAPIAEEKEAILITPVSAAPSISEAGSHVFRISASSDLMASNTARIVWEKGFKKSRHCF